MNDKDDYIGTAVFQARSMLAEGRYAAAFSQLRAAAKMADPSIDRDAEALEAKFFYMLRFIASNNEVADLDISLAEIRRDFEELLHRIEIELEAGSKQTLRSGLLRYAKLRPEESVETLVSDYIAGLDAINKDTAALTDSRRRSGLERISVDIFNRLWTQYPLSRDTAVLLSSIVADASLPLYDRLLWVNALGLNLNSYPSAALIDLLLEIHAGNEAPLSATAAVWLVLSLEHHVDDNGCTEMRDNMLEQLSEVQPSDLGDIYIEWARTMGTAEVSEKFKQDMGGHLREIGDALKSRMKDIDPEKIEEAMMNSDWLASDIGTDGFDSIKRFMEAQQKGEDVFMGTIGKMRSFDFFNTLANWFLPFHAGHSALASVVDGEGAALCDMLEKMPMICDSDKYALVLSMAQMPEPMRSSSLAAMSQQVMSLYSSDGLQEALASSTGAGRRFLINNVFKNIYRFFRLFRSRNEFNDNLSRGFRVNKAFFARDLDRLAEIGDALFDAKRYEDASAVYSVLAESDDYDLSSARWQKWGFAEEIAIGPYSALQIYQAILDEEPDDLWTVKRAAQCMSETEQHEEAVALLEPVAETRADDMELLQMLANAYAAESRWDDAVSIYHNLDYLKPDGDNSVKGDLAWALALTGDYELAEEMFAQAEKNAANLTHYAYLKWITGRRAEAVKLYEDAKSHWKTHLEEDAPSDKGYDYLVKNVPEAKSLPLLFDVLRYRHYGSQFGNII